MRNCVAFYVLLIMAIFLSKIKGISPERKLIQFPDSQSQVFIFEIGCKLLVSKILTGSILIVHPVLFI